MKWRKTHKKISLKLWPFNENDIVKLYWVDHPYRDTLGNWKVPVYFKRVPEGDIRRCDIDWGALAMLKMGRFYKSGQIINDEGKIPAELLNHETIQEGVLEFNSTFGYSLSKYNITTYDGKTYSVYRNVFETIAGDTIIKIPVIEVIRSMLAKNRRLIYAILQPNSLDYFFTISEDTDKKGTITLNFTEDYPVDLLTSGHLKYLLWLRTNRAAMRAWNEVYKNYIITDNDKGLIFSFPFEDKFSIRARYSEYKNIIRVKEVLSVKGLKIDYKYVHYNHPLFKESSDSENEKTRKKVKIPDDIEEFLIETQGSGARKSDRISNINGIEFEFEDTIIFSRDNEGKQRRKATSEVEKKDVLKNDGKVTAADQGYEGILNGIEFHETWDSKSNDGEIGEFLLILKNMQNLFSEIKVIISVDNIPEGKTAKSFCKFDDGITPRRYVFAEIIFKQDLAVNLFEVERERRNLSTLALFCADSQKTQNFRERIMSGLIENNGVWDNGITTGFVNSGIRVERFRHTNIKRTPSEHAKNLYSKIIACID